MFEAFFFHFTNILVFSFFFQFFLNLTFVVDNDTILTQPGSGLSKEGHVVVLINGSVARVSTGQHFTWRDEGRRDCLLIFGFRHLHIPCVSFPSASGNCWSEGDESEGQGESVRCEGGESARRSARALQAKVSQRRLLHRRDTDGVVDFFCTLAFPIGPRTTLTWS